MDKHKGSNRMIIFVKCWIGFVALVMFGIIVATAYFAATITPEDIGSFFGRVVAGFDSAKGDA